MYCHLLIYLIVDICYYLDISEPLSHTNSSTSCWSPHIKGAFPPRCVIHAGRGLAVCFCSLSKPAVFSLSESAVVGKAAGLVLKSGRQRALFLDVTTQRGGKTPFSSMLVPTQEAFTSLCVSDVLEWGSPSVPV